MKCIYFDKNGFCKAIPSLDKDLEYKPTEDEVKNYCTSEDMRSCPRSWAYQDYLKASRKK